MDMTGSVLAAGDTEMSVILPALQCPMGGDRRPGSRRRNEGKERHSRWGNGMRKCSEALGSVGMGQM